MRRLLKILENHYKKCHQQVITKLLDHKENVERLISKIVEKDLKPIIASQAAIKNKKIYLTNNYKLQKKFNKVLSKKPADVMNMSKSDIE